MSQFLHQEIPKWDSREINFSPLCLEILLISVEEKGSHQNPAQTQM
jgi:hypothetical protein